MTALRLSTNQNKKQMNNNINLQKIDDRFFLYLTQSKDVFIGTVLTKYYNQQLGTFPSRDIDGVTYFIIETFSHNNIFELTKKVQKFVEDFKKIEVQADKYDHSNIKAQVNRLTNDERYKIVTNALQYKIEFSGKAIERLAKIAYYSGYELKIVKRQEVELNESFEKFIR